jgi:hypothetical protein
MTMPPPQVWTIYNNPPPNPRLGDHLNGLRIRKIIGGYELKVHDVTQPIATVPVAGPPFTFRNVLVGGVIFDLIHVSALPPSGANGRGRWHINEGENPAEEPTEGDFTAQAGAGLEEDAEAASSANA